MKIILLIDKHHIDICSDYGGQSDIDFTTSEYLDDTTPIVDENVVSAINQENRKRHHVFRHRCPLPVKIVAKANNVAETAFLVEKYAPKVKSNLLEKSSGVVKPMFCLDRCL